MPDTWRLDQDPRQYRIRKDDGKWSRQIGQRHIVSVTQILGEATSGLAKWAAGQAYYAGEREGLEPGLAERALAAGYGPDAIREAGARRGDAIHLVGGGLAKDDEAPLLRAFDDAALYPYACGLEAFWQQQQPVDCMSEQVCGSRKHVFAGTYDLTARLQSYSGLCLIDYKSTRSGTAGWTHPLQLAAYEIARREAGLEPARNFLIVYLTPFGTYMLVDLRKVGGYAACRNLFLKQLALYRGQAKIVKQLKTISDELLL